MNANQNQVLLHPDRLYIEGSWVEPSSSATFDVIDSNDESVYLTVAEAQAADMSRAIAAARLAFDEGPWPQLSHADRAGYLTALATELRTRTEAVADIWPREAGVLHTMAKTAAPGSATALDSYAAIANDYPWEEAATPSVPTNFAKIVREPVGVVGAIIPWNAPLGLAVHKVGPALLTGCTVILKAAPEAPGAAYILAECAEAIGLPAGVLNVVTADREVSEMLVNDHRVDKIAFTGSTEAGRKIGSIMGGRIGRYTLELGGKSAAVILDDADLEHVAATIAGVECLISGQVCASLTRLIVSRSRHDEFVDALTSSFSAKVVGDAFDEATQMGPLAMARQRDRVEHYIAEGIREGATLTTGGGRPAGLDRGYFIEPTVFANVDNSSVIAREEIFGPVLSVIPVADEAEAVRTANDSIYGLNASVFSTDVARASGVAARLRSGTVGLNSFQSDMGIGFGGFKQSGIGREGGREGLKAYLETKVVIGTEPF
ncbi:MAG: aldehyde dehydrogenase [Nocardioidaceae bacterium]|nr:aldehyde dehydrogenase [Nocardioidaceae bacterium]